MENLWMYIIPAVVLVVLGFIAGKRAQLRAFCKELGEAFLATDEYLGIAEPTKEETEKFKKEWFDAIAAAKKLFTKLMVEAGKLKK